MNNQELLKRFADHYGLTVENAKDAGYGDISPLLPFFLLDAGAADVVTELRHHSLRHQMKRHARLLQDAYDQDGTDEVIARMDSMGAAVHNDYTIARLSVMRALRMDCDSDQAVLAASVVMMATVTLDGHRRGGEGLHRRCPHRSEERTALPAVPLPRVRQRDDEADERAERSADGHRREGDRQRSARAGEEDSTMADSTER